MESSHRFLLVALTVASSIIHLVQAQAGNYILIQTFRIFIYILRKVKCIILFG